MRRRLDAELVRRGLSPSPYAARQVVDAGRVLVGGSLATKPSRLVDAGEAIRIEGVASRFVGRGGWKLEAALERFEQSVDSLRVLDAGASTGGFTDCLLQRGARQVVALDVGRGQLHERLRADPRVVVMERTNLRRVGPGVLGGFDAAVADLSFISLTTVMERLVACVEPSGWLVLLVKPQFESSRAAASKGRGIITDPALWLESLRKVARSARAFGAGLRAAAASPLSGAEGNREFLLHLVLGDHPDHRGAEPAEALDDRCENLLRAAVAEAIP